MITDFQIFEKNWTPKQIPNWFFLVLRLSTTDFQKRKSELESLMNMEFVGLGGISDHYKISKSWFDVRDLLLVMKGSEVIKINNIEPIEYFNPDSLCKDNLFFWRRLTMNLPKWYDRYGEKKDIAFSSAINGIIQDLHYTNVRHNKKGGIDFNIIRDKNGIMKYMESSIYDISHRFDDLYHMGQLHINSLDDFTTEMLKILKEVVKDDPNSKKWPWDTWLLDIEDYILNKLKHHEMKRILKRAFNYLSHVYEDEGEWFNKGKSFKVPRGSILYFKEDMNRYTKFGTRGMKKEEIEKIVSDYGLNHIYDVRTVANHMEMMEILKTQFTNK